MINKYNSDLRVNDINGSKWEVKDEVRCSGSIANAEVTAGSIHCKGTVSGSTLSARQAVTVWGGCDDASQSKYSSQITAENICVEGNFDGVSFFNNVNSKRAESYEVTMSNGVRVIFEPGVSCVVHRNSTSGRIEVSIKILVDNRDHKVMDVGQQEVKNPGRGGSIRIQSDGQVVSRSFIQRFFCCCFKSRQKEWNDKQKPLMSSKFRQYDSR